MFTFVLLVLVSYSSAIEVSGENLKCSPISMGAIIIKCSNGKYYKISNEISEIDHPNKVISNTKRDAKIILRNNPIINNQPPQNSISK